MSYLPTYLLPMTTYRSNRRTEISTYRIGHGGNRTRNRVNLIDQHVDQYVTYQANYACWKRAFESATYVPALIIEKSL